MQVQLHQAELDDAKSKTSSYGDYHSEDAHLEERTHTLHRADKDNQKGQLVVQASHAFERTHCKSCTVRVLAVPAAKPVLFRNNTHHSRRQRMTTAGKTEKTRIRPRPGP